MRKNIRDPKSAEKWKQRFVQRRRLDTKIKEAASDILGSSNFRLTKEFIQHGNMTVNDHCMNVARYSLLISEKMKISCNEKDLIRGALLHDYFLYDWHSKEHVPIYKLHGFYHPGIALRNALQEYNLSRKEQEIIKKHMWPLTVVPPTCREAWIVSCADKWCSILETVRIHKGHGARKNEKENALVS